MRYSWTVSTTHEFDAVAGVLVGVDDDQPPVLQRGAIASVPSSGVAGSPVVPMTTIGPAPAPVIATRGSSVGGNHVQS